jgi:hypothetical protein
MNKASREFIWGFAIAMLLAAGVYALWVTAPQGCDGPNVEERRCVD